ncbi:MAG: hypothetical protein HY820_33610 [Acidobacteria bacterium]|nr:hypothetical protein [Acidobacteriota bacterium]
MIKTVFLTGILAAAAIAQQPTKAPVQTAPVVTSPGVAQVVTVEQQDANRTREELHRLLEKHPPTTRSIFALDPSLLTNQGYMAAYPVLGAFLARHPDVIRNPSYYFGTGAEHYRERQQRSQTTEMIHDLMGGIAVFAGFSLGIGLLTWLIRTFVDYRRWSRLTKIQTDVHTKLLDRFSNNEEIIAYMQSKPGAKFLESSPITLDAGPRAMNAPLSRILWALQGGIVLAALGAGFFLVSGRVRGESAEALSGMGTLGLALGAGFVLSAAVSFLISRRLGLIETPRSNDPGAGLQG